MKFFALNGSERLGVLVAKAGGWPLAPHEERAFEGGEHKARPLLSVRGEDVFVLHGLQGVPGASANDRLIRLMFFLATCKAHGAARVTAIAPYLAYGRKDRETKPHDPVNSRHIARAIEAMGTDAMITLDVHNPAAFQNAFRIPAIDLTTTGLFATEVAGRLGDAPIAVVSPDPGGVKRAQLLREALAEASGRPVDFGFMEKRRSGGVVSGALFAGDVKGRAVWIVDDMICGGGTLVRAAETVRERGAAEVHALAAHALMDDAAVSGLAAPGLFDSLTITDSTMPFPFAAGPFGERLRVVSVAPLIAEAIRAMHEGGARRPVSALPGGHAGIDGGQ